MKVGIFGGGFKPFTTGHFSKLSLSRSENDKTILYYALAKRQKGSGFNYTEEIAQKIFDIVSKAIEREYNDVIVVPGKPTPIVRIFKAIEDVAHRTSGELSSLNIDPISVDSLTIYSDPAGMKSFINYIGTDREEKYFGGLVKDGILNFDSGLSDEGESERNVSRMISSMQSYFDENEDLEDLINVRGSNVRELVTSREFEKIKRYLPPFLNDDEKNEVASILISGIIEETVIRRYVRNILLESVPTLNEALEAHILNFYEDFSMPLSEVYELADAIASGSLDEIQEKMDGQNVTFTVINGDVEFFSKGAKLSNVQRGGMKRGDILKKYDDRPAVRDSFVIAYDALQSVVDLNPDYADSLFQNGGVLVETALLTPDNPNTIVYEIPQIRFIQAVSVDPNIEVDDSSFNNFVKHAESLPTDQKAGMKMGFVAMLKLKSSLEQNDQIDQAVGLLDDLINSYGLSDSNTVGDLLSNLVADAISDKGFSEKSLDNISRRLATGDKKAISKKDLLPDEWGKIQSLEKNKAFIQGAIIPFERIIQKLGIVAFRNLEFALASNSNESGEDLRSFVRNTRNAFQKGKIITDPARLEQIKVALDRIGDESDFEKAVEGIVFYWKGKLRKLTGLFTSINKLRGFFAYSSNPPKIIERRKLTEGGNVFKVGPETSQIEKKWVKPTLEDFYDKVLQPSGIKDYGKLGSTGKKSVSGDLDIVVQVPEVNPKAKKELSLRFSKEVGPDNVKLSGSLIVVRYPIVDGGHRFVQIDVMLTSDDIQETEWLMSGTGSGVKGVYRNLVLAFLAKRLTLNNSDQLKYTVSFPGGLMVKDSSGSVVEKCTNPADILSVLGINTTPGEISTFESLVSFLRLSNTDKKDLEDYLRGSFACKGDSKSCDDAIDFLQNL